MDKTQRMMLAVTCVAHVERLQKLIAEAGSSDKFEVIYMKDPEEERKELWEALAKSFKDHQYLVTKEALSNPEPFYKKFEKKQGGNQCKRYPKRK